MSDFFFVFCSITSVYYSYWRNTYTITTVYQRYTSDPTTSTSRREHPGNTVYGKNDDGALDRSGRSIVSIDRVDRSGVSLARSVRDVSRVDATMDDAFARVDAVVADRAPPSVTSERGGAHGGARGVERGARVDRGRGRGRRRRAREERLREIRKSGGGDVCASWDREGCRGGGAWKREKRWVGRSEDAREEGFRGDARGGETEVDARLTTRVRWENDAE